MAIDLTTALRHQSGGPAVFVPNQLALPEGMHADIGIHGTTVIAVKYKDGVINVGDRRATANYSIMYDRAEKVLPIDDFTLLAISGSFARAMEVVRFLKHSFKYFERSQLQPMSLDGKLAELAKVIAAGVPAAMQGIGGVIPILTTFDQTVNEGRIFFYDGMGARFESAEFGAAGSGSTQIRGTFEYIVRNKGPFHKMSREEALREALTLLDIAADLDAATGGWSKVPPLAKIISAKGIEDVTVEEINSITGSLDKANGR
ncbi:MAG: proteasome subunit alpha [Chthonomonadales bacterium]